VPELAEVRVVADGLQEHFAGHQLRSAKVIGGKFIKQPELISDLAMLPYPVIVQSFKNKGKFLYWTFENKTFAFWSLAMTGSFGQETKHSAIRFEFDNGTTFYNDVRHFGSLKLVRNKSELDKKINGLGWDPLLEPETPDWYLPKLRKKGHKTIAEVMLDQSLYCGMGNYLRAEVLHRSGINPFRLVQDLTNQELLTIAENYRLIVNEAYAAGGTTIATFEDVNGAEGKYFGQLKVYGRDFDPNGYPVIRSKSVEGRTIHWVKEVQV
jgi:formamidopyrimidine-DNA glycosylase